MNNELEAPAADGGGQAIRDTMDIIEYDNTAMCSNAPRTFLNEDFCVLSNEPSACSPNYNEDYEVDRDNWPDFWVNTRVPTVSLEEGDMPTVQHLILFAGI